MVEANHLILMQGIEMIENSNNIIIMGIEINKITEIYPGHYSMLLDFPTLDLLEDILDKSYKYVWVVNYVLQGCDWSNNSYHLFNESTKNVQIKNLKLDFIMDTLEFIEWIPCIKNNLHILQVNKIPPYYLDLSRMNGKTKYDLLKKDTDYLFDINLPYSSISSDYVELVSPDLSFLKALLDKV